MDTPDWHKKMAELAAKQGGITTPTNGFYFVRHGETFYNDAQVIQLNNLRVIIERLTMPHKIEAVRRCGDATLFRGKFRHFFMPVRRIHFEISPILFAHTNTHSTCRT